MRSSQTLFDEEEEMDEVRGERKEHWGFRELDEGNKK